MPTDLFDAEVDRQRDAIEAAVAALSGADRAATPFAVLLAFWEVARPLAEVGGEPVRRRLRNALESVIADVLPEMLQAPPTELPAVAAPPAAAARIDDQWSPSADAERLAAVLTRTAQAADTAAAVRAVAAVLAAEQLAAAACEAAPPIRPVLVNALIGAAQHLHPALIVMNMAPPISTTSH